MLVEGVTERYWSPRKPWVSIATSALVRILYFARMTTSTATERPSGINSKLLALPIVTPDIITSAVGLRPAALANRMRRWYVRTKSVLPRLKLSTSTASNASPAATKKPTFSSMRESFIVQLLLRIGDAVDKT